MVCIHGRGARIARRAIGVRPAPAGSQDAVARAQDAVEDLEDGGEGGDLSHEVDNLDVAVAHEGDANAAAEEHDEQRAHRHPRHADVYSSATS